jgi:hypothetical protein
MIRVESWSDSRSDICCLTIQILPSRIDQGLALSEDLPGGLLSGDGLLELGHLPKQVGRASFLTALFWGFEPIWSAA